MADSRAPFDLTKRVNDMVREYVVRKTQDRCELKWEEFLAARGSDPGKETKYRDAREKVCTDAFLAMRSRRSRQDFVDYFTSVICAVPQFLPPSEHAGLAQALLDGERWEDVKALSMLALSGLSRI